MVNVDELFSAAGVSRTGVVRWGETVPQQAPGVYLITTTSSVEDAIGLSEAPINLGAVDALLQARPEATVDGTVADRHLLSQRLQQMWIPGEPVVYIGLSTLSVRLRIDQFYKTALGARAPHAGGWPVKVLRTEELWVHYGECVDPDETERALVHAFIASIPLEVRTKLIDPNLPLPFANLTVPKGSRKKHGISGVKESRKKEVDPTASTPLRSLSTSPEVVLTPPPAACIRHTQNVTLKDIEKGTLRLPQSAKSIFPQDRAKIWVEIGDHRVEATWDPRTSGAVERSGTLRIGRAVLEEMLEAGGPRRIIAGSDSYRIE